MRPSLLDDTAIQAYLDQGYWSRQTMAGRYDSYAQSHPDRVACRDARNTLTWAELKAVTDRLAAHFIGLGIARDARAMVQMASSCREVVLRIAFKKAGIIGAFVPLQWRRKELDYVMARITPAIVVLAPDSMDADDTAWLETALAVPAGPGHRINPGEDRCKGWQSWEDVTSAPAKDGAAAQIPARRFKFDEVSVITTSSGTSGLAKLCEWPEAAQICVGRGIGQRLGVTAGDNVGVFSPLSGAAGVLVWSVSGAIPCTFTFPDSYRAPALLELAAREHVTVATTVPVILARLAQEDPTGFDLGALRVLRVGTAAADTQAAKTFEDATSCQVVVASGSMECPGFGHADANEAADVRLNGSVGLPLPSCRLRIADDAGTDVPVGTVGEVHVSAAFAASGYWRDPGLSAAAWTGGWYATGDMGHLDSAGRLWLFGRAKEIINRSGHKILPAEVEQEIARHPDVFECAVVKAPDPDYGEVPWAFVQARPGAAMDTAALVGILKDSGMATYKIPVRFVEVTVFPRVAGNKIDKKLLLEMAPPK